MVIFRDMIKAYDVLETICIFMPDRDLRGLGKGRDNLSRIATRVLDKRIRGRMSPFLENWIAENMNEDDGLA